MSKRKSQVIGEQAKRIRKMSDDENGMDLSQNPDFEVVEKEAEVGIVESIVVKNFMCHAYLEFKFNPNVNFITGRNGSGKSAVLTALVIGLGGKASATNRGTSLKTFIKSGKPSADIIIKLRNRGSDSYKPEIYGDSIYVHRKIRVDGASTYSIKNNSRQTVSNRREELNYILDQFNIQVDNPVSILNQDTSRNFLHSKSPYDKYKFFLKATQLENMKHDYVQASEQKNISKAILKKKTDILPALEQEVQEWEHKFKAMDAIKDAKTKVQNLKAEMAWSYVNMTQKEMEGAKKVYDKEEKGTPKFIQKLDYWKGELETYQNKKKETEEKLRNLGNEVKELEPKHSELKKKKVPTATLR